MKAVITNLEDRMKQFKSMKTTNEVISDIKNGRYQKYPISLNKHEQELINEIVKSGMSTGLLTELNTNIGCSVYDIIMSTLGDEQFEELIYIHIVMYIDLVEENGEYKLYRYAVNNKMACKYLLCLESSEDTSIQKETLAIINASLIEVLCKLDHQQSAQNGKPKIDITKSMDCIMDTISHDKDRMLKFIIPRRTQFLSYDLFAA